MVGGIHELKDRTVWRKYLKYVKEEDSVFGVATYAGVFCVREVSGYAIWYQRYFGPKDRLPMDGSYLLRFYAPSAKFEAIAFAVQITSPGEDSAVVLSKLDELARGALCMQQRSDSDVIGPIELID